jgi:alpha-glucosidase
VNHQIYSDREPLRHFDRFAKVYAAWKPYRMELVKKASQTGLPVLRHPFIHYPNDPEVLGLTYQYMVGPEFMVAPVLDPGSDSVEIYLPAGKWVHLWTGERYGLPRRLRGGPGSYRRARRLLQGRFSARNPLQRGARTPGLL